MISYVCLYVVSVREYTAIKTKKVFFPLPTQEHPTKKANAATNDCYWPVFFKSIACMKPLSTFKRSYFKMQKRGHEVSNKEAIYMQSNICPSLEVLSIKFKEYVMQFEWRKIRSVLFPTPLQSGKSFLELSYSGQFSFTSTLKACSCVFFSYLCVGIVLRKLTLLTQRVLISFTSSWSSCKIHY